MLEHVASVAVIIEVVFVSLHGSALLLGLWQRATKKARRQARQELSALLVEEPDEERTIVEKEPAWLRAN